MDTLDYAGTAVNEGSKGVLLGYGDPVRNLPREFTGSLPQGFDEAIPFCGGCLVVQGPSYEREAGAPQRLAASPSLQSWPLVVLVDDAKKAAKSAVNFLWTTFTRFEPAADIHAHGMRVVRHQPSYAPPIVIDARMKPSYPKELFCDDRTRGIVDRRWREYFPQGDVAMGDEEIGIGAADHRDPGRIVPFERVDQADQRTEQGWHQVGQPGEGF